jgi:uncharacterized protein
MTVHCLVVAKAPVPGEAKTRLAADLDDGAAADLAAAALLDTLDACAEAFPVGCRLLALTGDLGRAARGEEIRGRLEHWRVFRQQGEDFPARLAHAHTRVGAPVVQVGMDTPQLTPAKLRDAAALLDGHDAVVGPADDGGWWLLALRDSRHAAALREVPMSTPATGDLTIAALRGRGLDVVVTETLRDVDEVPDAVAVSRAAPGSRFAATWAAFGGRAAR